MVKKNFQQMKNKTTVQFIPDSLFETFSRYSFGDPFKKIVTGFPNLTLIQPIKIDSQDLAIGLHRDVQISQFFLFDSPIAYLEKNHKRHQIITIFAGKAVGLHGTGKQFYKNRIYCDVMAKVKNQQNFLHPLSVVLIELDKLVRKYSIQSFIQGIPLQDVPVLDPIMEGRETTLNV